MMISLVPVLRSSSAWLFSDSGKNYQKLVILEKPEIMARNTSVSLGDHFEAFVDEKVSSGRYQNASEVIRAGLRLLEEEDLKLAALRNALALGLKSGLVKDYQSDKHLASLKKARVKRGS
jgi:antitoxin ParD1/3/4